MSYLVLARKYRPQTFDEIVGQEHVTRTLGNAFEQDRVHHAFLFCGPRGVGKTTAARVLGKALNCEKGPTSTPCNECSACTSISSGTSVDYFEMDGASNRGIDAIRDLTEAVRYQPAVLRKKVYVIDEVHMLTTEAFNALLKTLEEPPPHVCFVLATTEPHKLPNTILSRCQRYDFKLVPGLRLSEYVATVFAQEEIEIEPSAIHLVVRESGGSVRDAMSICDQVISFVGNATIAEAAVAEVLGLADRALTSRIVDALSEGQARVAIEAVDAATGRGLGEVQLARALVRFLRDLAVIHATGGGEGLIEGSSDELAQQRKRAEALEPARVRLMFERMLRCCEELGHSQNPRLVLDLALIDLSATEPLIPLGGLLDRLSELEGRLLAGGASPRPPSASSVVRRSSPPARVARAKVAPPREEEAGHHGESAPAPVEREAPVARETPAVEREAPAVEPTPAARAPQASGQPLNVGDWEEAIAWLETKRKLSLVRLFQEAKLLECGESQIVVGFGAGTIDAELASEKEKLAEMSLALSEHFGRAIEFQVRALSSTQLSESGASAQSLVERSRAEKQVQREALEREARGHPMTKVVLDTFGATIKEIKTDV